MRNVISLLFISLMPLLCLAQRPQLNKAQLLCDVKVLSADSMGGRQSGSHGSKMAQQYIVQRFSQIGLKLYNPGYEHPFILENSQLGRVQAVNLVGFIPGKSGSTIVVTAHYDHIGTRGGKVYNGADDNASGVGALLAAAAYFSEHTPEHTLVFAALDAEEQGLRGAEAFLLNPPLPLDSVLLNVNLDMLGINSKGELYASGTYHYPHLKPILEQVAPRRKARLLIGHDLPGQPHHDWTNQSDHYQFHKRGIPFIYFGVEDHPHYHQPSDDYSQLNTSFYPDAAALVLEFLKLADSSLPENKAQIPESSQ